MAWNILQALWLFLPAYVANMAPVFVAKILPRWNAPIDGGRVAADGNRILGPGKTWRGLVGGVVLGSMTAVVVALLAPHWDIMNGWDYGHAGYAGGLPGTPCTDCPQSSWAAVAITGGILGGMALVGDAVKSYFKRRRGIDRGGSWFPFDQLDFVVFGILGLLAASPILAPGWVFGALLADWSVLATLLVLTPALHLLVNRIGYWLGLKEVPW